MITSDEYINQHLNGYWRHNLQNYTAVNTVLLAQVDTGNNPLPIEHFRISVQIESLGLDEYYTGTYKIALGFIQGYTFTNKDAACKFQDWANSTSMLNLVVLQPVVEKTANVKMNAVPLGLTESFLISKFANYSRVINFKFTVDKEGYKAVQTGELTFKIILKDNVNKEILPTFLMFRGVSIMIIVQGMPPTCLTCREHGHVRQECKLIYCQYCKAKQLRNHPCANPAYCFSDSDCSDLESSQLDKPSLLENPTQIQDDSLQSSALERIAVKVLQSDLNIIDSQQPHSLPVPSTSTTESLPPALNKKITKQTKPVKKKDTFKKSMLKKAKSDDNLSVNNCDEVDDQMDTTFSNLKRKNQCDSTSTDSDFTPDLQIKVRSNVSAKFKHV